MMSSPITVFIKRHLISTQVPLRECSTIPPPKQPVVTILNAGSGIGKNLALLLKQSPYIGELRLYDEKHNVCTIAEDLSHIDTKTQIRSFCGQPVLRQAITDADIVVTVGGDRESSKEDFDVTFDKNADDVRITAINMIEFNPRAIFCIARPPVEALVPLVSEEYKKAGVYDWKKIFGVTNTASMRANSIVAAKTNLNPLDVLCPIIGGLSSESLVAVLSQVRPKTNIHSEFQKHIVNSEDDVLKVYGDCKGIYLMPAFGVSRFVNTIIKALKGETNCVECAFVRQISHIGNFLPYMTSIVRLGRHGVLSTHMPKVNDEEGYLLQQAAIRVKEYIRHGESFVTGEPQTVNEKPSSTSEPLSTKEKQSDQKSEELAATLYFNKPLEQSNIVKAT